MSYPVRLIGALLIATVATACGANGSRTDTDAPTTSVGVEPTAWPVKPLVSEEIEPRLREMYADFGADTRYFDAAVDLNGDGKDELIVYVVGPMVCGTGGCNTLVFTPGVSGYEMVGDIALTRPPIRVSSQSTNGWRDLVVHISGGGIQPGFDGEIPFDGTAYQSNPTSPRVEPASDPDSAAIVIPEFDTLTDAKPLYTE